MWIRQLFAIVLAAALFAASGAGAQNSPDARRVLDRARAASGGAGWNMLRGWHEVGSDGGVAYERWLDPLRYGARTETQTPTGKATRGFNGAGEWRIAPNGVVQSSADRSVLAQIRAEVFFDSQGYLFPSRFDARAAHIGVRQHQGHAYDVLRSQPHGGLARELWFDRRTGLLSVMVEAGPRPIRVELSDYRRVGPVLIPFRTIAYGGDLPRPRERRLESLDFKPADRSIFSLPPPPP